MKKVRHNRRDDYLFALFDLERKLGFLASSLRGAALSIRAGDPDGVEAVEAVADVLDGVRRHGVKGIEAEIAKDMLQASYAKRGTGRRRYPDDVALSLIEEVRQKLAALHKDDGHKPTTHDLFSRTGLSRDVFRRVVKGSTD